MGDLPSGVERTPMRRESDETRQATDQSWYSRLGWDMTTRALNGMANIEDLKDSEDVEWTFTTETRSF